MATSTIQQQSLPVLSSPPSIVIPITCNNINGNNNKENDGGSCCPAGSNNTTTTKSSPVAPPEWAMIELNGELLPPIDITTNSSDGSSCFKFFGEEGEDGSGKIELGLIKMDGKVCTFVLCFSPC